MLTLLAASSASTAGPDFSGWVTAVATVVLTFATIALAVLTWQLAKATRSPAVIATIEPNGWAPTLLLDIHLANEGTASAFDITISFDPPIPQEREGQQHLERASILRAGQKMVSTLVDAKLMINTAYQVKVSWADKPGGKQKSLAYPVDISSIKGLRFINGGNPLFRISEDIRKLREQIDRVAKGQHRIEVDSYTSADREQEERAQQEMYEQIIAREKKQGGDPNA